MSDYVCEELIVEIFTRLPPKSLLRFRSLSQSLRSLISSPGFIRMHTFRSPQKLLIRHREYDSEEEFCTLHSEDQLPLCPKDQLPILCPKRGYFGITPVKFPYNRYPDIVGSCNGILCLYDNDKNTISLWNPSIRRKLALPDYPRKCFSNSRAHIGFGFDPVTDDYKIVCIHDANFGEIAERSFVYTMKTGTWCEIASLTPYKLNFLKSKACFVNGTLNWVVVQRYLPNPDCILTFDVSTHVFGMIVLPEPRWDTRQLTIVQGSLAMISVDYGDGNSWIWVRRDASWSVFSKLKTNHPNALDSVLQLTSNGDILVNTFYQGFQVHNYKTGERSRLVGFNAASHMFGMEMYIESLQLLDFGTANDIFLKEKDEER